MTKLFLGAFLFCASAFAVVHSLGSAAITANRAMVSDSAGAASAATTTATEIGYVNGVTSAIQTQLGTKITASGGAFTGDATIGADGARISSYQKGDRGESVTLAVDATNTVNTGVNWGAALLILDEEGTANGALVMTWGNSAEQLVAGDTNFWSTTADTASKVNVYRTASNLVTIQNKTASSVTIWVSMLVP